MNGVGSALVRIQSFDELMQDLLRLIGNIDTTALDVFASERQRRTGGAPAPSGRLGWPVVRLNAIQLTQAPKVCRRVVCEIGDHAEAREAVEKADVRVLVSRVRAGVLAYGSDADVRKAFGAHRITEFDLHAIDPKRLRYESGERGLLREAL